MGNFDVLLQAGFFSHEALYNIRRWYNGDISGARAAKNIVDEAVSIGGGIGGCSAGSTIGSHVGPMGAIAGCAIGSVLGSVGASSLSDYLTIRIFSIPREEAVEKAYKFFELPQDAAND